MKSDQISALLEVSEMMKQKDFALLGELNRRKGELLHEIECLDDALARGLRKQVEEEFSSFNLISRQAGWQRWHRQKKQALQITLANLEAERELQKTKAKESFGRSEALQALQEKLRLQVKSL